MKRSTNPIGSRLFLLLACAIVSTTAAFGQSISIAPQSETNYTVTAVLADAPVEGLAEAASGAEEPTASR